MASTLPNRKPGYHAQSVLDNKRGAAMFYAAHFHFKCSFTRANGTASENSKRTYVVTATAVAPAAGQDLTNTSCVLHTPFTELYE